MHYNKLIRDNIPEIIESNGGEAITHIANDQEYKQKLEDKFYEEGKELFSGTNVAEELADILEVCYAIGDLHGVSKKEIDKTRLKKLQKRGGFTKRIILDKTT